MRIEDIDFGYAEEKRTPLGERGHIVLLLGSGFSVPCGMPTGKQLNDRILHINKEPITISWDGRLGVSADGVEHKTNSPQDRALDFLYSLMQFYANKVGNFDYEQFYDFMNSKKIREPEYIEMAKPYLTDTIDYNQLLTNIDPIYNQIIDFVLGKYRKTELQDGEFAEDKFLKYKNFVSWLNKESENKVIDIFTLNHDLLIENLSKGNWLSEKISDGFDDYRSRYYGELNHNGVKFNCKQSF